MTHTAKRIEHVELLQQLKRGDESPGETTLRIFRAHKDLDAFVDRLAVVFEPALHWAGPDIVTIIRRERGADGNVKLQKRPVAFRVKDFADGWIIFQDEARANHEADEMGGALMQGLYVRDGS